MNYLHFGDIDAGGFHIYNDLCKRHIFLSNVPYGCRYVKNMIYIQKLTKNDEKIKIYEIMKLLLTC